MVKDVCVGIIGLGNVGGGTLQILLENGDRIAAKLGFRLWVKALCALDIDTIKLPEGLENVLTTKNWREVVTHPEVDVVVEVIGGTTVAREIIDAAIANGKSVVTANKELLGLAGAEIWANAFKAGINMAMEASVAGGIPIHTVLREGISGDRVAALMGILNGTSNYILTEIESKGRSFDDVLKDAQRLGYAEANPSADVDGFDARSKLALLSALAFGVHVKPAEIHTEGIRRITPLDFQYAHRLGHTIRLLCSARQTSDGLAVSVRPALIPEETILAGVRGSYNAIWVRGVYGEDTFYYGRGAGPRPTGVAVVSDLMRVAREIRSGSPERVSPFAHEKLTEFKPVPASAQKHAYFIRFRVVDQPGIIAKLAGILAEKRISLDAVLQLPCDTKNDLPFVITVEPTSEQAVQEAVASMAQLDFMVEPPLALPIEKPV